MTTSPVLSPKIAFCWDTNHTSKFENEISDKLVDLKNEKFMVFSEKWSLQEKPSLSTYSIELLRSDKKNSTAPSTLLLTRIIAYRDFRNLGYENACGFNYDMIQTLFFDEKFRSNFINGDYKKFRPSNLDKDLKNWDFSFENLTKFQISIIEKTRNLFINLESKNLDYDKNTHEIKQFCNLMWSIIGNEDLYLFEKIAQAIAFQDIANVKQELGTKFNPSKELDISFISRMNQPWSHDYTETLLNEISAIRSQHQAKKVTLVLKKRNTLNFFSPEPIIVVRLGRSHREVVMEKLRKHFPNGDFQEVEFKSSENIEQKIQSYFPQKSTSVFEMPLINWHCALQ